MIPESLLHLDQNRLGRRVLGILGQHLPQDLRGPLGRLVTLEQRVVSPVQGGDGHTWPGIVGSKHCGAFRRSHSIPIGLARERREEGQHRRQLRQHERVIRGRDDQFTGKCRGLAEPEPPTQRLDHDESVVDQGRLSEGALRPPQRLLGLVRFEQGSRQRRHQPRVVGVFCERPPQHGNRIVSTTGGAEKQRPLGSLVSRLGFGPMGRFRERGWPRSRVQARSGIRSQVRSFESGGPLPRRGGLRCRHVGNFPKPNLARSATGDDPSTGSLARPEAGRLP